MRYLFASLLALGTAGLFFLRYGLLGDTLLFGVGVVIGIGLMVLDELVGYQWYSQPPNKQLITRSPLFLVVYAFLSIFVLTSTGSALGLGLMISLGMVICTEMATLVHDTMAFQDRFLTQVQRALSVREVWQVTSGSCVFMGYLIYNMVW